MSDDKHGEPNPIINALSNAVAAIRADEDQLALAKAHEALHPKAIEKLSVEEARRQPTAADAVHHLLTLQGRSTDPETLVPGLPFVFRDTSHMHVAMDGAVGGVRSRQFRSRRDVD